jgi:cytochrome c oxidase cbb3-type subunit 3
MKKILLILVSILGLCIAEELKSVQIEVKTELKPIVDEAGLAKGKEVWTTNCLACHGANGEGLIGPNMTDEYWIHGGSLEDIVHIINVGVITKGMIPWEAVLTKEQVLQVSSYLLTMQGTKPANGKAPEGELYIPKEKVEIKITK